MPTIEITDSDFQRLQKIAIPLVDTATTVVTRVLDIYENYFSTADRSASSEGQEEIERIGYSIDNLPPLSHTRFMGGQFAGEIPRKPKWDSFVCLALSVAFRKCQSVNELRRISGANIVEGFKDTEGYKLIDEYNFSYQGVSAERAAEISIQCAKALKCEMWFEFVWRDKEEAYRPGCRGHVSFRP